MGNDKKSSLDILGLESYGEAVNTATKGVVDGLSAFLGRLCLPAAEEFGLLLKDKITSYRMSNLAKICAKAQRKIEEQNQDIHGTMNPKLLKEIVEESSWVESESLQDMWAGLLAGAAMNDGKSDEPLIYINTLKRLSAFQSRLINLIYKDPRICSIKYEGRFTSDFIPVNPICYTSKQILELSPIPLDKFVPIANATHDKILNDETSHMIAIGRFAPQIRMLQTEELIAGWTETHQILQFLPSLNGLDFYMRCSGYSMYPIEAYFVTRRYWLMKKGIDPLTWKNNT